MVVPLRPFLPFGTASRGLRVGRVLSVGVLAVACLALCPKPAFAVSWGRVGTIDSATATNDALCWWNSTGAGTLECSSTNPYIVGGFLGIGTAAPQNTLDVYGTGLHIGSGVPSATLYNLYNNGGTLTWNGSPVATGTSNVTASGTANYLPKFTGATTLGTSVLYQSGSNVGIGTSSPGSALQVAGSAAIGYATSTTGPSNGLAVNGFSGFGTVSPNTQIEVNYTQNSLEWLATLTDPANNASIGYGPGIKFKNSSYSNSNESNKWFGIAGVAGANWSAQTDLVFYGTSDSASVAPSEIMRITGGGNVGIGTTSPLSKLSISGNLALGSYGGGATAAAAPSNGLIVSGNVGIGTTTTPTGVTAAVNGVVQVAGTGSEPCTTAQVGSMRYNPGGYFEICTYP